MVGFGFGFGLFFEGEAERRECMTKQYLMDDIETDGCSLEFIHRRDPAFLGDLRDFDRNVGS